MTASVDRRARAIIASAIATALTVLAACHAPLADRRVARSWHPGVLEGKVIVLAPLEQGTPSFGGSVDPSSEVVRAAQERFDVADAEFAVAADYHRRQLGVAQRQATTSALRFRFPSLSIAAYRALRRNTDAWLSVSVDEKTFQAPKREALRALGTDADLVLVLLNHFEREGLSLVGYEETMRTASTLCASDFLLWDYGAERVVAEGSVEARAIQQPRWITPDVWQQLATETMEQILRVRPFVDD